MLHNDVIRHGVKLLLSWLTLLGMRSVGYLQLTKQVIERHYFIDNLLGDFGRPAVTDYDLFSNLDFDSPWETDVG